MVDSENAETGSRGEEASGFVASVKFEQLDSHEGRHVEQGQPTFTHLQFTHHPVLLHRQQQVTTQSCVVVYIAKLTALAQRGNFSVSFSSQ